MVTNRWSWQPFPAVGVCVLLIGLLLTPLGWSAGVRERVARDLGALVPARGAAPDPARALAERAGVDVDKTIEIVRHHIVADDTHRGSLRVGDGQYRARFDTNGFAYQPLEGAAGVRVVLRGAVRGSSAQRFGSVRWSSDANVASRSLADGIDERVTAHDGSLEWDIVLTHAPAGDGDLQLRADLAGVSGSAQRSGSGLRWTPAGGGSVEMSPMTVRDGHGAALYRALPDAHGNRLTLRVPDQILEHAAYPITVDPTVSAPYAVSQAGKRGDQAFPAVAADYTNGTGFLVVWEDTESGSRISGTRVDAAGQVLDPGGLPLGGGFDGRRPAVAWNGVNYLLVYYSDVGGGAQNTNVDAQVIGTDGSRSAVFALDGGEDAPSLDSAPSVSSAFDGWYVVWQTGTGASAIVNGIKFDNDTTFSGALINPNTSGQAPVVAGDPSGSPAALVVWKMPTGEIKGIRCCFQTGDTAFQIEPSNGTTAGDGNFDLAAVSDGSNYLVTWTIRDSDSNDGIVAQQVSGTAGPPLIGSRFVVDFTGLTNSAGVWATSAVTFDGANYLVTWSDFDDYPTLNFEIFATPVSTSGSVGASKRIATGAGGQIRPAVASNGVRDFVAWQEGKASNVDADPFGARLKLDATPVDSGIQLAPQNNSAVNSAVAFNGTHFLVVWEDHRTGTPQIFGALVTPAGFVYEGPFPIGITGATDQNDPTVASNGTDFAVVWVDHRAGNSDLYGTNVFADGTVENPGGVGLLTSAKEEIDPALVSTSSGYWLTYADNTAGKFNIMVANNTAGVFNITSNAPRNESMPALAWNSTDNELLVTYRGGFAPAIYAKRFDIDTTSVQGGEVTVASTTGNQDLPAVAWNGSQYMVVWQDTRNGAAQDVYGSRVSSTGAVLDPSGIAISTQTDEQSAPDIAWNSLKFVVLWHDRRSGTNFDIYGTELNSDGTPVSTSGFVVSNSAGDETQPAITPGPSSKVGITYQGDVAGTSKVFLRTAPK